MAKKIKITLIRGLAGRNARQQATAISLGLKSPNQSTIKEWSPAIQGMIDKIPFMLKVEEVQ